MHHQFELEGGYSYRSEVYGVLNGLGFSQEDYQKKISQLSGGQKDQSCAWKTACYKAGHHPVR